MAADQLGQALHDQVSAQLERPNQLRSREGIIHRQQATMPFSENSQLLKVRDAQQRIRQCLNEQELGRSFQRLSDAREIICVNQLGDHAEATEFLLKQLSRAAIK